MSSPRSADGMRDPWSTVYAQTASDSFNARLHGVLRDLTRDTLAAVGDPLVAVVVAGAYGEGSGKCVTVNGGSGSGLWSHGQAPADDVEILVVANAPKRIISKLLVPVSRKYAGILQVPVHFVQIMDEAGLARVRPTLAWYELVMSHQLLFGSEKVFDGLKQRFGIVADGCSNPEFTADEAQWIHTLSGFRTIVLVTGQLGERVRSKPEGHYFHGIRRLGDAVLVNLGLWAADREERDRAVLALGQADPWFASHGAETTHFIALYRDSIAWLAGTWLAPEGPVAKYQSEAAFLDIARFAKAWLFVDQSLLRPGWGSAGRREAPLARRLLHAWVRRWLVHHLASGWHESPRTALNLFARLGEWYYRSHQ